MNEKAKALLDKVKEKLKSISKKVYIIAVVVLVLIAATIAFVLNNKPYSVLITEASADEMTTVMSFLQEQGVTDYKIENSNTVLVPAQQENQLKANLAMKGFPQSAFGYSSYYDHVGALSTESEKTRSWIVGLQDRIGAVIREFDHVVDAWVNITPGEDRGYVLDSGNVIEAEAAVVVSMSGSNTLTKSQVKAIRDFVAHSASGLQIDRVTISDTAGNTYNAGEMEDNSDASALKLQLEEEWENKIRTEVMRVLTPFYGEDNVRVAVNCVVDVHKTTEQRTDVILPEGAKDGKGLLTSEQYQYHVGRPDDKTAGGIVGSETNSDIPTQVENAAKPNGTELEIDGSGQKDYDNSKSEKQIVNNAAVLRDCTVSVSLNSDVAGGIDEINVNMLRNHIARAAGIGGTEGGETDQKYLNDKISIISMKFAKNDSPAIIPVDNVDPLVWIVIAGVSFLLLIVLFVVLLIRKRRKKRKMQEELENQLREAEALKAAQQAVVLPAEADVMTLQSEKNMELRKDIRKFANDNPEIAAQIVRNMLKGGDDDA